MSRKVLYRAWDKKYKVMLEGFAIYDEGDQIGMSWTDSGAYYTEEQTEMDMGGHFGSGDDWLFILNDFELMEFSGLKDVNNKDIYEGDLFKKYSVIYVIIFTEGAFCGSVYGKNGAVPLNWGNDNPDNFSKTIEIIGNIHDNPELLQP